MAMTLTNGIAMFIPSVQESLLNHVIILSKIGSDEFTADELGELKKFSQMDYPEIVTIHWTNHHLEILFLNNVEI